MKKKLLLKYKVGHGFKFGGIDYEVKLLDERSEEFPHNYGVGKVGSNDDSGFWVSEETINDND